MYPIIKIFLLSPVDCLLSLVVILEILLRTLLRCISFLLDPFCASLNLTLFSLMYLPYTCLCRSRLVSPRSYIVTLILTLNKFHKQTKQTNKDGISSTKSRLYTRSHTIFTYSGINPVIVNTF